MDYPNLHVLDHPLSRHALTILRNEATPPAEFRAACKHLTSLLAVAATSRHLAEDECTVSTPIEATRGSSIIGAQTAVAILRAGLGMLDAVVDLLPSARVGFIGLERNEVTAVASSYYAKLPPLISRSAVFLLDPMLATGGSAVQACDLLRSKGATQVVLLSIVAAPIGVEHMLARHPDVFIYTAALDRGLNDKSYIVPGLGDFGDRLYGT